jgi:hypothetical protein
MVKRWFTPSSAVAGELSEGQAKPAPQITRLATLMIPVPLFDLNVLQEMAAGGAGTSNRRR